jgi:hypothetical protein
LQHGKPFIYGASGTDANITHFDTSPGGQMFNEINTSKYHHGGLDFLPEATQNLFGQSAPTKDISLDGFGFHR